MEQVALVYSHLEFNIGEKRDIKHLIVDQFDLFVDRF